MKKFFAVVFLFLLVAGSSKDFREDTFTCYKETFTGMDRIHYDIIRREALRQRLPVVIALAIVHSESRFKSNARSYADARGLFQVMPFHVKRPRMLYNPVYNTYHGVRIFKMYLAMAHNNLIVACKYYNAGPKGKKFTEKYIAEINYNIYKYEPRLYSFLAKI